MKDPAAQGFIDSLRASPVIDQSQFAGLFVKLAQAGAENIMEKERKQIKENDEFGLKIGLKVGDLVEGVVQSIQDYGAFIDLDNGIVGLLHISQISHKRVLSVEDILEPGDRLKVLVLDLDAQRKRVELSTKKLEPSPGNMLRDRQLVFDRAEEMAENNKNRRENESF